MIILLFLALSYLIVTLFRLIMIISMLLGWIEACKKWNESGEFKKVDFGLRAIEAIEADALRLAVAFWISITKIKFAFYKQAIKYQGENN